jgi:hypothetical protein
MGAGEVELPEFKSLRAVVAGGFYGNRFDIKDSPLNDGAFAQEAQVEVNALGDNPGHFADDQVDFPDLLRLGLPGLLQDESKHTLRN